jgi:HEAT repeat protein
MHVDRLKDQNRDVRIAALRSLTELSAKATRALPALLALVEDTDDDVLMAYAIKALIEIDVDGQRTVKSLRKVLRGNRKPVMTVVIDGLGLMAKKAEIALPDLEAILKQQDVQHRQAAAIAVLRIEPNSRAATLLILADMVSKDPATRLLAIHAAKTLGPVLQDGLQALIRTTKDEDEVVRAAAAQAIGAWGEKGDKAVSALCLLTSDPSKHVRVHAVQALGKIGPKAKECVPLLLKHYSGDSSLRRCVLTALDGIGEGAKDHLERIMELIDDDPINRVLICQALGSVGKGSARAASRLILLLTEDAEPRVRGAAARALGEIGMVTKDVIKALDKASVDPDLEVQGWAEAAKAKLGER